MKIIFVFIVLSVFSVLCYGQENFYLRTFTSTQVDSLKAFLVNTSNDTLRLKVMRQLGVHYEEVDRDSSLKYHELRLVLARKLNQKLWEADALDAAGWVMAELKNYPRSLQYFLEATKLLEDKHIERNIWNIGIFAPNRNPEYARLTVLALVKNDFSQLYNGTGEVQKELECLFEGLSISESINNQSLMGLIHSNISETYYTIGKTDMAIEHGETALKYMRNSNYTTYIGYASLTVGNAYLLKNDFEQAEIYLEAALEADKKYSVAKLPGSNLSLAKLYQRLNNLGKAIHFANNALYYSRKAKDVKCQTESYSMLYTIYNSQNRNDSAFHFLQLYKTLSDSLNRVERDKIYEYLNLGFNEQVKQQGIEQARTQKANYIRLYTILLALGVMVFISFLLFRNNRNRKKANTILQQQKERVETTLSKLKTTQSQLIQSEKMASLGELTAGIAHEIQNPLNFVNNFSEVNTELIGELEQEVSKGNLAEVKAIVKNIKDNEQKINHHGKRAGDIVKGMLQHSRTSSGQKELTDINLLCDEYLRLAYHGLKAKDKSFNAKFETELDASLPKMNVVPQDIGRVILNLITNAFYAVNERLRQAPPDSHYEPTVSVSTKKSGDKILVSVKDNGNGIPQKVLDKIFQPFFTTKPTGQGTGLGLSLSYDIVKAHGGEIKVNTNENEGTEFTIKLPA